MRSAVTFCTGIFALSFAAVAYSSNSIAVPSKPLQFIAENASIRIFDFSHDDQLNDLKFWWMDPSFIENGYLKCPIEEGTHKGLGKKYFFAEGEDKPTINSPPSINEKRPTSATLTFKVWLDRNFQKDGADNEIGKFSGFEGIYDQRSGWGGRTVTDEHPNSWSVRIGHAKENAEGKVPIGLYIYHPGMKDKYGTPVNPEFSLNKEQFYTLSLFVKLNDIGRANGIVTLSVDGKEIYRGESWLLRIDERVRIVSAWLNVYIGGLTPSKHATYVLMDDLKIESSL